MIKKILMLTMVAFFAMTGSAFADDPVYTSRFNNKAVNGYDTVSYFMGDGVPVKGKEEFHVEWNGADWHFASQENLEKFKKNPTAYAPQYGGYCAWAVAHGTLAKGDANTYHLENGKLYLNYDKSINEGWLPRRAELIKKADVKYPDLVDWE